MLKEALVKSSLNKHVFITLQSQNVFPSFFADFFFHFTVDSIGCCSGISSTIPFKPHTRRLLIEPCIFQSRPLPHHRALLTIYGSAS